MKMANTITLPNILTLRNVPTTFQDETLKEAYIHFYDLANFVIGLEFCTNEPCNIEEKLHVYPVFCERQKMFLKQVISINNQIQKIGGPNLKHLRPHEKYPVGEYRPIEPKARATTVGFMYGDDYFFLIFLNFALIRIDCALCKEELKESLTKTLIHELVHVLEGISGIKVIEISDSRKDRITNPIYDAWLEKNRKLMMNVTYSWEAGALLKTRKSDFVSSI
jgi:hypothetical protein